MGRSQRRNQVLIVVPPNTNTIIKGRLLTVTRPEEHSDWSDFMSLGALSLVSEVAKRPHLCPVYIDGTVIEFHQVLDYISSERASILAVCISTLTANYEAGLLILEHAKLVAPEARTIVGNDHFTALPTACLSSAPNIDYGFFGNEVIGPFGRLIDDLYAGEAVTAGKYPSLAMRDRGLVRISPSASEPVFTAYDYARIDEAFEHSSIYRCGFRKRVAPRVQEIMGRNVHVGMPVDIGRGCIKFANNNACSFCSIQYGGLWKNALSASEAWQAIESAARHGADYLYLTADELPLTFGPLLRAMSNAKPSWWTALRSDDRPVLVGYARADGIANEHRARLLMDLGVRQVMIGMDAGSGLSLAAMNKPLQPLGDDFLRHAETLFQQNREAIRVAKSLGLAIRIGFVIGHLGMTPELLHENVDRILDLLDEGKDVFTALDIEVLSPQPGSLDFNYLTMPDQAVAAARALGLGIATEGELEAVASRWRNQHIIVPENAMRDYASVLMPGIRFDQLAAARATIREHAKMAGIVIGEVSSEAEGPFPDLQMEAVPR